MYHYHPNGTVLKLGDTFSFIPPPQMLFTSNHSLKVKNRPTMGLLDNVLVLNKVSAALERRDVRKKALVDISGEKQQGQG